VSVLRQNVKAIRLLANEAYSRGCLSRRQLEGIVSLKMPTGRGVRAGNWLQIEDVIALMKLPDRNTEVGCRDAAILGLMVGCGLRRAEIARLEWKHYQVRENRRVLVDLLGKGLRVRTVPVPDWVERDIQRWFKYATLETTKMFDLNPISLWYRVKKYAALLGKKKGHEHCANIAPHDLRRTFAKLSRKGGASIEQVSLNLGPSALTTTMKYISNDLELVRGKAASDFIDSTGDLGRIE
jgi:integrase